jgi:hypothetical protein
MAFLSSPATSLVPRAADRFDRAAGPEIRQVCPPQIRWYPLSEVAQELVEENWSRGRKYGLSPLRDR